jgi:hypothetical protein
MLTSLEPRALAFVQLNAIIGAIPELVRLSPSAATIAAKDPRPTSIALVVNRGPRGVLGFDHGTVTYTPDTAKATILLPFATPGGFSKVIDGAAQPIPVTGLHRVKFLLDVFAPLTKELEKVLRPGADATADELATSTRLTLYVAMAAAAQVANHDASGTYSAKNTPDGDIAIEVGDDLSYTLRVTDHRFTFLPERSPSPRAAMTFSDLAVVGDVLSGKASAMKCICAGTIAMRGMLSMVDNANRILDRVGQYLGD